MKKFIYLLVVFALTSLNVFAQTTTSDLVGTVAGPDGLVPGASVVVRSTQTGQETTTVTNSEGGFRVTNLEVGIYSVTVTANGFKTYTANNVRIEIGRDSSIRVPLEVGGIEETVVVTAGEDIINSVDAKINNNVSRKQLDDLPSLGRNPLNFVSLQAGAASNPSQLTVINGVRTSATNTTIDGINVQDNFIRSNATDFSPARPTVDEVEEFSISTQANAGDGFGGAQIGFTTRSGTNRYNLRLFEFNRNSHLAANQFFNNANGIERPFRNRNQFGGNLGGPLPFFNFGEGGPLFKSGKDRLFFFFSYEKLIDRDPAPPQFSTVLTQNARQGLFTYTAAVNDPANNVVAGQLVTVNIFNPALNTGITGINPIIASRFLANIPGGNSTQVGDQRVTTGRSVIQNFNANQTNYASRIDFLANSTNRISGTYRFATQTVKRADIDNSFNIDPRVDQPSDNPLLSLSWNSAISSRFTNEVRGGFFFSDPIFLRLDPNPSAFFNLPLVTNPEVPFQNQGRKVKTYNLQNNSTFLAGNHTLRFGGQFQSVSIDAFNDAATTPTYTIGTGTATPAISVTQFTNTTLFPGQVPAAQRAGANGLLALLGGIVSGGSQAFNVTSQTSGFVPGATQSRQFSYEIYGAHFADQWRVRNNFTLNLGVRYDVYTGLRSDNGLALEPVIPNLDDPRSAVLDPNGRYQFVGGNIGKPGQFYETDKNNVSPVLGFAYTPNFRGGFGRIFGENRTVIRGGYRFSYINDELVRAPDNALLGNQGLNFTSNAFNPLTGGVALNSRIDNVPAIPAPVFNANRTFALNNAAAGNFGTVFAVDPKIQSPRVQEYSIGIQREVGFNTAVEFRYVGTRSKNLIRAVDFNQVIIRENGFLADFNRARGNLLACQAVSTCTTGGAFNPAVPGSQQLTVFPNLGGGGGLLQNATITGLLSNGEPGQLAFIYLANNLQGTVNFVPNRNAGVADLLFNGAEFYYNALQIDLRRRFTQGLSLNANYTFSKNLTNADGVGQTRFEPLLDNAQPEIEYARALFDQTHKFNLLTSYELPFGVGRRFLNSGAAATIFGNFQIGAILQIGSGAPISITDARGTLNRGGRSGNQTALSNLSKQELKSLAGVYRTPNGIFFLPPEVLGRNPDGSLKTGRDGRGVSGNFDDAPFAGQVFFRNIPGQTSGLERLFLTGPTIYNLDLSLIKRFVIGERYKFQLQGDLFNVFNTTNFIPGQFQDINSTQFGRISNAASARVTQLAFRFEF